MQKMIEGSGLGFKSPVADREDLDDKLYRASKAEVKRKFRPEFINRLDKLVVFRSLSQETLRQILKLELVNLQQRIWSSPFRGFNLEDKSQPLPNRRSIAFRPTPVACNFLLKEGTSEIYGARELNRTIDRYIGFPLAALISSHQLEDGDKVKIDYVEGEKDLTFLKEKV
jgi:ATP-dependent Clp protease ATP-binding subunit ClpA